MAVIYMLMCLGVAILLTAPVQGIPSVTCEHETQKIGCPTGSSIKIQSANYGRTNSGICSAGKPSNQVSNTNCHSDVTSAVSSKCDGSLACDVTAANSLFGDPCVGTFKYLYLTYECENPSKNVKVPEHSTASLGCADGTVIGVKEASYGKSSINCHSHSSLSEMQKRCDGKQTCQVAASNSVFGDPCVGTVKELTATYQCVKNPSKDVKVAEHSTASLDCADGTVIKVKEASYGKSSINCHSHSSLSEMQKRCDGKQFCQVAASNSVFGDPCVGTVKELTATYQCAAL